MNFSDFVRRDKQNRKLNTSVKHFSALGGEDYLGVSFRHFSHIENRKRRPSTKLLAKIFIKTRASERKNLLLSYFQSASEDAPEALEIVKYLEQYLSPEIERETDSVWDSTKRVFFYSDDQLDYFNENSPALRLFNRILLLDSVSLNDARVPLELVKQMDKLGLIQIREKRIHPVTSAYRVPTYENSNPRTVEKGTAFVMNQIRAYVSKEGSPKQQIRYAMQLVKPEMVPMIMEQFTAFKTWIQSLANTGDPKDLVPFVFVGFAKELEKREL